MYKLGTAPGGTYCPWMTTGTCAVELIVTSGKLKGFALIGIPAMLATLTTEGGVAGSATWFGVVTESGPMVVLLPIFVWKPSSRIYPVLALILAVPVTVRADAMRRMAPALPEPPLTHDPVLPDPPFALMVPEM